MRIIGLEEHGKVIQPGDSVIQLDPADVTKYIVDRETALESQLASLETMLVNQENRGSENESTIKSELATYELRKLTLEAAQFESERTKKIKELEFQQATIALNLAKRKLELNEIINANDLKIQQIRVNQIRKDIQNAYDIIPQLTIRSEIPGIFQIHRNWRSGQLLQVGDEVWRGNSMGYVPDLTWMKVETCINENDFLRINVGTKVLIRLDALPEVAFEGEVSRIGRFCHPRDYNNPRQKVFDVEVRLLVSDERLKPGMTVSCEYLEDAKK
jgi:multidrug resistance efflux pump